MKSKLKIPSTLIIILTILLLAIVLTWVIPGGEFVLQEDGTSVFNYVENNPYKIWDIPLTVIQSAASSLSIILVCAMGNCLVTVSNSKGAFDSFIAWMCKKNKGKEESLIVIFTIFFALLGFVVPPQCFIGFTPAMVLLSISIGFDSILGLGMVMLSVACSAMAGPINSITAIAQSVVGLPIYSGIAVRFLAFGLFLLSTILYFLSYARKIKKDRTKSYMYGLENIDDYKDSAIEIRDINRTDKFIFVSVVAVFGVIAVGSMIGDWSTDQISAVLLVGTVFIGLIMRYSLDEIYKLIISGIKDLTGMYTIIVLANAIGIVLKSGNILNTIIYAASEGLKTLPGFIIPAGVMIFICIMNVILPSGAGKAVMIMPIIAPIGQAVGMSAQSSVLAYTFGDGFSNYIIPHDASTISYLNAAKIPYGVWIKFMNKLFVIWCIVGTAILTVLYYTGYGPF